MNKSEIFSTKYKSTLKECSCDNSESRKEYMTNSSLEVINFDAVKNDYVAPLKIKEIFSNDALFIKNTEKEEYIFIEFKNGKIDARIVFEIRKKIYDSLAIFCDIFDLNIKNTRENLDYILVYNMDKEHIKSFDEEKSDEKFFKNLLKNTNEAERIRFGLRMFKTYFFKDVHTYTTEEFKEKFVQKYEKIKVSS